jgi:hypothetical protein
MSSKQDNTLSATDQEQVQIGIRIPADVYKAVAHEAIERDTTAQQLWIDAMRKFLKLAA